MRPATLPGSKKTKQKYRVLCVDDNEVGLFVNTIILRNEGYDVIACSDAEEAVATASSEELDLAILDYEMPGMSGAELAAVCKAANPDIKVIFYSGYVGMPNWELALADLLVTKSDGVQALLEGIAGLLPASKKLEVIVPTTANA
jgi:CheY-like chemotaxis protein